MDRVVLFACVMLVMFGAFLFSAWGNPEFEFKDVFEVLSYMATLGMAFFAWQALTAWKKQFNHQKHFEVLQELRQATNGLMDGAAYLKGLKHAHMQMHQYNDHEVLDEYSDQLKTLFRDWRSSWGRFCTLWNAYGHLVGPQNPPEFKFAEVEPMTIDHNFRKAKDMIEKMEFGVPRSEVDEYETQSFFLISTFQSDVFQVERTINNRIADMMKDI
ncbi:hypothetical protein ACYST8_05630 [Pseudomonas inefficax]